MCRLKVGRRASLERPWEGNTDRQGGLECLLRPGPSDSLDGFQCVGPPLLAPTLGSRTSRSRRDSTRTPRVLRCKPRTDADVHGATGPSGSRKWQTPRRSQNGEPSRPHLKTGPQCYRGPTGPEGRGGTLRVPPHVFWTRGRVRLGSTNVVEGDPGKRTTDRGPVYGGIRDPTGRPRPPWLGPVPRSPPTPVVLPLRRGATMSRRDWSRRPTGRDRAGALLPPRHPGPFPVSKPTPTKVETTDDQQGPQNVSQSLRDGSRSDFP